ncbi:hypothetical protein WMF38_26680 [Sorangium sp. So ce118]
MPNQKSKRIVVLQSSVSATTVGAMNVTMDASFTTNASTSTTNKFEDVSASSSDEKTRYRMAFAVTGGADIGCITLQLIARGEPGTGVTVNKTTATSDIVPTPVSGGVTVLDSPAASFERIWKQSVIDANRTEYVDDIAKLDMRVSAAAGYTVAQTVTTQATGQLVISYVWKDANGSAVLSGSVTLDSSVTAGSGYDLGSIGVTDNNPTTGEG